MANPEHLKIIKQGVEAWNNWVMQNPSIKADLSQADLRSLQLGSIFRRGAHEGLALRGGDFSGAQLAGLNFDGANLIDANFSGADLSGCVLTHTLMHNTNFSFAILHAADFTQSIWLNVVLGNTDLSNAKGLEETEHFRPSVIDHQTVMRSKFLPRDFMRKCGLPEAVIESYLSLLKDPSRYYSCFISYSSTDQEFVDTLYADLQDKGVRCWLAPNDMRIGAPIRPAIDASIQNYDKLLLILSETSLASQWVEQEVETALAKERKTGRTVLFPIRIDDAVLSVGTGWPAYLKNTRNIGNFSGWRDRGSYSKAFDRLLRDLKAEEAMP